MRPTGYIRMRSKGTFELSYNLGNDPLTGKRKRIALSFKGTKQQAEKELRRILRTLDTGEYVEPTSIKTGDFLAQWRDAVRNQVSPKTHERYAQIVDHYLIPRFGACPLMKLSPMAIQQVYIDLETKGSFINKERGLSPKTRLDIHRIFKLALKHAVRMRLITFNPADNVKAPRIVRASIDTLTVEQSADLLEAVRNKPLYWPVLLALATGMRRGEIAALRWKNVDFDNKTIRVVESVEQTKAGTRFKSPKTNRTRAILLPEYAVEELRRHKELQTERLARLNIVHTSETLVCARYDGKLLWPSSLTHEFMKLYKKRPDLPRIRFHDLRHSHATQLLAAGIHPKIAQERLGHSTISTTLDLYSHATDTMQDEAAFRLDSAYRDAFKPRTYMPPKPS